MTFLLLRTLWRRAYNSSKCVLYGFTVLDEAVSTTCVIAGLVPATPLKERTASPRASVRRALCPTIGVAGTSPAMTIF
jgi:hypothetical protein